MSLQDKFKNLEKMVLEQIHLINQFSGIPFVILIYDPQDQKECYEYIEDIKKKLENNGKKVLQILVGDFVFNYFEGEVPQAELLPVGQDLVNILNLQINI